MNKFIKLLLILPLLNSVLFAQEETEADTSAKQRSFKLGLYVGSYFANKYTAGAYDGYGFDLDGVLADQTVLKVLAKLIFRQSNHF